jgi:XTP/dITP diphosphohydrolase
VSPQRLDLVVASANPDKVGEIAAILGRSVDLRARPPEVPEVVEDGDTLEANARLKAVAIANATGRAAVADDTGFFVDALDGAPGILAARYAGEHGTYEDNVAKVLRELDRVGAREPNRRRGRFETVALVRFPSGDELFAVGVVTGTIVDEPRGTGRFGYDPIFVPDDGDGRTFAEMTAAEKHAVSHRGRAFRALSVLLAERAATVPGGREPGG